MIIIYIQEDPYNRKVSNLLQNNFRKKAFVQPTILKI